MGWGGGGVPPHPHPHPSNLPNLANLRWWGWGGGGGGGGPERLLGVFEGVAGGGAGGGGGGGGGGGYRVTPSPLSGRPNRKLAAGSDVTGSQRSQK